MSARIEDLEPVTRAMCEALMAKRPDLRVTWTLRTDAEQMHLYQKGRAFEGGRWIIVDRKKVVTKAMPGQSPHNEVVDGLACAFDVCFRGPVPYPDERTPEGDAFWQQVGADGKAIGLAWGGDWKKFKDRPHFERPDWKLAKEGAA